jgi:hypothetical protein
VIFRPFTTAITLPDAGWVVGVGLSSATLAGCVVVAGGESAGGLGRGDILNLSQPKVAVSIDTIMIEKTVRMECFLLEQSIATGPWRQWH